MKKFLDNKFRSTIDHNLYTFANLCINYLVVLVYKFFVFPLSVVNIAANITPTKNANTIVIPTTSDMPLGR